MSQVALGGREPGPGELDLDLFESGVIILSFESCQFKAYSMIHLLGPRENDLQIW